MKKMLPYKRIACVFLLIVMALIVMYQKNLVRLYTAITLYDQDKIANNFLTMYESFNATVIPASTELLWLN